MAEESEARPPWGVIPSRRQQISFSKICKRCNRHQSAHGGDEWTSCPKCIVRMGPMATSTPLELWYCSPECLWRDADAHAAGCSARRQASRVLDVLQDMFGLFEARAANTFFENAGAMYPEEGDDGGLVRLALLENKTKAYLTGANVLQPLPTGLLEAVRRISPSDLALYGKDKDVLDDFLPVVKHLLRPICRAVVVRDDEGMVLTDSQGGPVTEPLVDEVQVRLNVAHCAVNTSVATSPHALARGAMVSHGSPEQQRQQSVDVPHWVLRAHILSSAHTKHDEDKLAVDLSGAQFGWRESWAGWKAWTAHRAAEVLEINELGGLAARREYNDAVARMGREIRRQIADAMVLTLRDVLPDGAVAEMFAQSDGEHARWAAALMHVQLPVRIDGVVAAWHASGKGRMYLDFRGCVAVTESVEQVEALEGCWFGEGEWEMLRGRGMVAEWYRRCCEVGRQARFAELGMVSMVRGKPLLATMPGRVVDLALLRASRV